MGRGSNIFYKHLGDLSKYDMRARMAAERAEVACLKERVARRKKGTYAPAT